MVLASLLTLNPTLISKLCTPTLSSRTSESCLHYEKTAMQTEDGIVVMVGFSQQKLHLTETSPSCTDFFS